MTDEKMKTVKTSTLLHRLFKAPDLQSFLSANGGAIHMPEVTGYLNLLCKKKNRIREHVIKDAGIERSFGHQLFRGSRSLSRDNALRLALGFGLSVDETQELLKIARKTPLYPKIKRDAVILHGLAHQKTIVEMQSILSELGLSVLGGEKSDPTDR